jgi:serine/threonine protein kinase
MQPIAAASKKYGCLAKSAVILSRSKQRKFVRESTLGSINTKGKYCKQHLYIYAKIAAYLLEICPCSETAPYS